MLSPTRPTDPTSGTFAFAQQQINQVPKQLKVDRSGVDLDGLKMGERVVLEDENGQEVAGQVFLMLEAAKGLVVKAGTSTRVSNYC